MNGVGFDEALLDEPPRLADADGGHMLRAVATAGPQLRESRQLTDEVRVGDLAGGVPPRTVVVVTDGAAAVLGDLLRALAGPQAPSPVVVLADEPLPLWAGPADLLLVAGHGGADDAMLGVVDLAARRGVPMLGTGPRDTPLAEAVVARGRSPYVGLPLREPARASLWALLTPILIGAARTGLVPLTDADLLAAADVLDTVAERCRPASETFVNPGKSLAVELVDGEPVVWGSSPMAGVAARRLAGQLAGNAAVVASHGTLPWVARELGGVLAGPAPGVDDFFRDRVEDRGPAGARLVLLRDDRAEDALTRRCVELARRQAGDRGLRVSELLAEGESPLERFASLVALADFATVYCGLASGLDPAGPRLGDW
jgi:hypothetical protein